jgi:hypothetical protein
MIATLLGASIGVPYAVSHKSAGPAPSGANAPQAPSSSGWSWPSSGPAATVRGITPVAPVASAPNGQPLLPPQPLGSVPLHPVETVLRFDLSRQWVYRSWDRKSTGPTDVGLEAVRVALVSGTDISSLAGSLTYFFNDRGAIEHISFRGTTGNSTRLVDFLTRTYHFARVASPTGEQVYQIGSGERVQSELRLRPEAVMTTASPHTSIAVELELARPGSQRYLPPRMPSLQIPQVAAATPPPTAAAASSTAEKAASADPTGITSGVKSSFDKARYATPQEESELHRMRWPN